MSVLAGILALPHIGFVIAAYAAFGIVVAALIATVAFDHQAQLRALAAQGRGAEEDGASP
jgi:heme exporter protein CcmD